MEAYAYLNSTAGKKHYEEAKAARDSLLSEKSKSVEDKKRKLSPDPEDVSLDLARPGMVFRYANPSR